MLVSGGTEAGRHLAKSDGSHPSEPADPYSRTIDADQNDVTPAHPRLQHGRRPPQQARLFRSELLDGIGGGPRLHLDSDPHSAPFNDQVDLITTNPNVPSTDARPAPRQEGNGDVFAEAT